MGVSFRSKGDFSKVKKFFQQLVRNDYIKKTLEQYGREGVAALASATPVDTGLTASSWGYEIAVSGDSTSIYWTNSNVNQGVNIAIILQYGHGTRNGGYVVGRDYINPAIQPIFDKIADSAWKEVMSI